MHDLYSVHVATTVTCGFDGQIRYHSTLTVVVPSTQTVVVTGSLSEVIASICN